MRPLILPGDQVQVEWLNTELGSKNIRVGDLVLGRDSGSDWILHRVIARKDDFQFQIKGDAAFNLDVMDSKQVWGRVKKIKKNHIEMKINSNVIDYFIAALSKASVGKKRFFAALIRRTVFLLGFLRRLSL